MNFDRVKAALKKRGYAVSSFETAKDAADYLDQQIDEVSVSFGGSLTLSEMGVPKRLASHNTLCLPSQMYDDVLGEVDPVKAMSTDVFLTSVNALAETGEMISIDGIGNRVASMMYGHKKVYLVIGRNKLAENFEKAVWRARNIAAPQNAKRLHMKTPCAVTGRCHDCSSPERICRGVSFIYRNKLVSFSDYFKRRYDSNFIILLYSGIGPFACAASMGGQLVAAKAIFQAFGIDPTIGLVITAAVMLVYTMFAGLWGSYATAVFQVGVIIVGVLVVGISMFTQGGIAEIHAFYPAEKFDLFNISPELQMMFVGPMVLSVLVDQTSVQRAASAKTEATAFWGHLLSCIPLFLFGWLMVYIGMWSGAEFPDAGGNAFIVMLMNKVSPIVCAVMICAILAAIMSTASGALVATDALVVHDLYCGFINKNATEEQQKRLNLIVNIVVSVAAVVCALAFTNVIDLLSVGYTIMLSGTLVPLLGGIIWKRGTTKGAAASAAVGMITALLSIFGVITVPFSSIFPVLPGAVTYIVVSLCTKHAPTENTAKVADVVMASTSEKSNNAAN